MVATCAVALILIALYGAGLSPQWRFSRDSAIYMGLARSIVEGQGYTFNYEPHTHYIPGFPVLLAGTARVFGAPETLADSFLAYNALITLLGLGSIVLFYFMLRELALPPRAFWAAFLFFALSANLYSHSTRVLSDVPFTFFGMAALLCGLVACSPRRGWKPWAGLGGAGAMLVVATSIRPVGPLLLAAVAAGIWLSPRSGRSWKERLLQTGCLFGFLALVGLAALLRFRPPGTEGSLDTYSHGKIGLDGFVRFFQTLFGYSGRHFGGIADCVLGANLGWAAGMVLAAAMLPGLARSLRRVERQLSVFAVLLMAAIIWGGWRLNNRYVLPANAVLFYWLALGGEAWGDWLRDKRAWWNAERVRRLGYACVGLVLAVNLVRIGGVIHEQRGDLYQTAGRQRAADYQPVADWLRENAEEGDVVAAYESSFLHYFTRLPTRRLPRHMNAHDSRWLRSRLDGAAFAVVDRRYPETAQRFLEVAAEAEIELDAAVESGQVTLFRVVGHPLD